MTSRELYELLAPVRDGFFVTDSGGSIRFWGPPSERCFGWSRDEIQGKRCWEALRCSGGPGEQTCGPHCELISKAVALCPGPSRYVKLRNRDKAKWCSESTFGTVIDDHEEPMVVHICHDVDRAKRLSDLAEECISRMQQIVALSQPGSTETVALTSREVQVLAFCAKGRSSRQIATELGIAVTTVRNHVQNILEKLQCHTRVEAIFRARDSGLL